MKTASAAARTSTGRVRNSNEDAYGYRADRGIYVVCDGMGGAAGGEIASRMAVETVLRRMTGEGEPLPGRERLHEAITEANRTVQERAEREAGLYGMGTTLVALLLGGGAVSKEGPGEGPALIAHAGDSRCYLFRQGTLTRCTNDHSLVDEQIRLGTMTQEEAERSPFRSVITRAIGTQKCVTEEYSEIGTEAGDLFVLCTDGLTREVTDAQMAEILREEPEPEAAAQRLIDTANASGGRDNITCVLVRVG